MPPHSGFPNYYELFGIPVTATPAEIRNGHIYATARDTSLQHQQLCDKALRHLENREVKEEYDKELREWNKKHLEIVTTKTREALHTIEDVNDAIDSADRALEDAGEIVFEHKFTDQARLKIARTRIHRLCRGAVDDAGRVKKWSQMVLESCEEADRHVAEFQYLMRSQAKSLESQIRKVERDAQSAGKKALSIIKAAHDCEAEVEKLISAAPQRSNPVKPIFSSITGALTWLSNALELTIKIIKYTAGLIAFLLIAWLLIIYALPHFMK